MTTDPISQLRIAIRDELNASAKSTYADELIEQGTTIYDVEAGIEPPISRVRLRSVHRRVAVRRQAGEDLMFTDPTDTKLYALAGHATLTMTSQKTGARYTFKISQARDRETGEPKQLWFVALLAGPDNEADYQYVGMLNGTLKLTKNSRFSEDSTPIRAFRYFWQNVDAGRMPPQMEVRHEGSCGRCGRKLTVPESIDRGIGPECASKMGV